MQLIENEYFKKILEEEKQFEVILANELKNSERYKALTFSFGGISLDITRQLFTLKQFAKLKMLGKAIKIEDEKKKLFDGFFVNVTEDKFVTHFNERKPNSLRDKTKTYKKFISFLKQRKIRSLINIGIGGSDLGVKMVYYALKNHFP